MEKEGCWLISEWKMISVLYNKNSLSVTAWSVPSFQGRWMDWRFNIIHWICWSYSPIQPGFSTSDQAQVSWLKPHIQSFRPIYMYMGLVHACTLLVKILQMLVIACCPKKCYCNYDNGSLLSCLGEPGAADAETGLCRTTQFLCMLIKGPHLLWVVLRCWWFPYAVVSYYAPSSVAGWQLHHFWVDLIREHWVVVLLPIYLLVRCLGEYFRWYFLGFIPVYGMADLFATMCCNSVLCKSQTYCTDSTPCHCCGWYSLQWGWFCHHCPCLAILVPSYLLGS